MFRKFFKFVFLVFVLKLNHTSAKNASDPNKANSVFNDILNGKAPVTRPDSYIISPIPYNPKLRPTSINLDS